MTPTSGPGVALVYPYFRSRDPVEKLFPPLGIAYLASQLRELGVPVTVEDCTFWTFDEAVDRMVTSRPAIIGISIMVTMSRNAFDLLRELRERLPGTLFVAGGPLPTVNPAMFAEQFDVAFCGESDLTFPRFCHDYLTTGSTPGDLAPLDLPLAG
jgi:anaerobic magnesium-protoporphyrin IX monomethyl ester cyclase